MNTLAVQIHKRCCRSCNHGDMVRYPVASEFCTSRSLLQPTGPTTYAAPFISLSGYLPPDYQHSLHEKRLLSHSLHIEFNDDGVHIYSHFPARTCSHSHHLKQTQGSECTVLSSICRTQPCPPRS